MTGNSDAPREGHGGQRGVLKKGNIREVCVQVRINIRDVYVQWRRKN